MNVGIVFLAFFATLLIGTPIGVGVGLTCLTASASNPTMPATADFIFRNMVTALDTYSLLAVPLFILSGVIMARGGISKKLFDFFAFFIGKKTAGLPIAVVVTCLFYGAISGSGPATVAAVGAMSIPLLVRLGYDREFVTAMVAVSGGLGVIIPPSIPFIMYGLSSGKSVGALFIAGVLPGILIGACLMIYAFWYCKRHGEDREKLEANYAELHRLGFWGILKSSFWALLTPVIILGGIYGGVVTPTEAADISVIYVRPRPHNDARSADHRNADDRQLLFYRCADAGNQSFPALCWNDYGHHSRHPDSNSYFPANYYCSRGGSDSLRRYHGGQSCDRICYSANRRQPVCRQLFDRYFGSTHCPAVSAVYRSLPDRTDDHHLCPADQSFPP